MKITSDMINIVLDLMAKGKSEVQVSAALHMSKQQFRSIVDSLEGLELRKAVEFGKTLHEAFYEDLYKDAMLRSIPIKEGMIKAYMQNKFGWNEKTEVIDKTQTASLTDEQLEEELERLKA